MKKIFFLFVFFFYIYPVIATTIWINVKDNESNENLSSAQLIYNQNEQITVFKTNENGNATIENIVFPFSISIKLLGYEDKILVFENENDFKQNKKNQPLEKTIFIDKKIQQVKETIITAQPTEILAEKSIYKVQSISSANLKRLAAVSLDDALRFQLNNFVSNDNILGSSVNIGGLGGQQVKILLNGVPLNGNEGGFVDLGQLNLQNVERIEMVQGPMSVLYGSNAMGGIINLISQKAKKEVELGVQSYSETFGKINWNTFLGINKKNHNIKLSVGNNNFLGWSKYDTLKRAKEWNPKTQLFGDFQYNTIINNIKLNTYTYYLDELITNKGETVINSFKAYAFDEYYKTKRFRQTIGMESPLWKTENIQIQATFNRYNRIKNRYRKDMVALQSVLTENIGDQDTSTFNQFHLRGNLTSTRWQNLEPLIGIELIADKGISSKIRYGERQSIDVGTYASLLWNLKKFSIQPSFRFSTNNIFGVYTTPALHLKYNFSNNLIWRSSFAKGYRVPTLKEMYLEFIDVNHTVLGNEDLQPEKGIHIETSLEKNVRFNNKSALAINLNLAYNNLNNQISLGTFGESGLYAKYINLATYQNAISRLQISYKKLNYRIESGLSLSKVLESSNNFQGTIFEFTSLFSFIENTTQIESILNYKFNTSQPITGIDGSYSLTGNMHLLDISFAKKLWNNHFRIQMGIKNVLNFQNSILTTASASNPHNAGSFSILQPRTGFLNISYNF